MAGKNGRAVDAREHGPPNRPVDGDDERLEWNRIADACGDIVPASFPYGHRWMAWACWTRAEERDPQPTQCSQGRCLCFVEGHGALEHWRGQRDAFERVGTFPRDGFATPQADGSCPHGVGEDDATLNDLFGASVLGSDGPIALPGRHAILHLPGCVEGERCAEDGTRRRHRWHVEPEIHRPADGARFTTVTIDWSWSNENIASAIARLRSIVGTAAETRQGGAPFWNRYGPARAMALHDHRARGGSVRKWAAEEAERRGADPENERVLAQRLLAKIDAAIDSAAKGDLRVILGW